MDSNDADDRETIEVGEAKAHKLMPSSARPSPRQGYDPDDTDVVVALVRFSGGAAPT